MAKELEKGPVFIHRSVVLDGLRGLYLAQHRFSRVLKEENYACGYRDGFEDALHSLAEMAGVATEFEQAKTKLHTLDMDRLIFAVSETEE